MPEISRFFGIVIAIFYDDHNPPHIHVRYGGEKASIAIRDLSILEGHLTPRVIGLVTEWMSLHKEELLKDWENAMEKKPLFPITPLA
ncbi:MAG: DUF4160 domain-containing protein [Elusimicrobia bacterium]|nr:DUF4160 domain-containing protein [Elusimicrobiota bacterium]